MKKNPWCNATKVISVIFNASTNGLDESVAIVRVGRKVLLNEAKFFGLVEGERKFSM
jgi:hypothetical protein